MRDYRIDVDLDSNKFGTITRKLTVNGGHYFSLIQEGGENTTNVLNICCKTLLQRDTWVQNFELAQYYLFIFEWIILIWILELFSRVYLLGRWLILSLNFMKNVFLIFFFKIILINKFSAVFFSLGTMISQKIWKIRDIFYYTNRMTKQPSVLIVRNFWLDYFFKDIVVQVKI